jgi:hypothetical protein
MPYERWKVSGFLAGDETFDLVVAYMCLPGRHQLTSHSEHRPLEAYSRALEAAGLLTEAIREPSAPARVVADSPGQRRWPRIPSLPHRRAAKP